MNTDPRPSASVPPSRSFALPAALAELPVVRTAVIPRHPHETVAPRSQPSEPASQVTPATVLEALTDVEARVMRAVAAHPGDPSSLIAKRASTSPRRALEVRKSLLAKGFLREHHVNRAGKGRTAIVLEVTEAGHAALQRAEGFRGMRGKP